MYDVNNPTHSLLDLGLDHKLTTPIYYIKK
jgi:hypothetical protein